MKALGLFLILNIALITGYSQVESLKIGKDLFFKPSVNSMGYLMLNVDSVIWKEGLAPIGLKSLPSWQKVNALEFKKVAGGISQYIGFDDRFWVLTIIWKDESGKNSITKSLKKSLKKFSYNSTGYYKIKYKEQDLIISIESNKEKVINEMITVEIERK